MRSSSDEGVGDQGGREGKLMYNPDFNHTVTARKKVTYCLEIRQRVLICLQVSNFDQLFKKLTSLYISTMRGSFLQDAQRQVKPA